MYTHPHTNFAHTKTAPKFLLDKILKCWLRNLCFVFIIKSNKLGSQILLPQTLQIQGASKQCSNCHQVFLRHKANQSKQNVKDVKDKKVNAKFNNNKIISNYMFKSTKYL